MWDHHERLVLVLTEARGSLFLDWMRRVVARAPSVDDQDYSWHLPSGQKVQEVEVYPTPESTLFVEPA